MSAPPTEAQTLDFEALEDGMSLEGVEPGVIVTVVTVKRVGDAFRLVYDLPSGETRSCILTEADRSRIRIATKERPWSFEGDGKAYQLAVEAKRIELAHLFDPMMAVHTSNVQPLPHQITAVYQSMLPRQPLRFVLADDPGAGKTIMAGLYIRELIMRADAQRILIVAPGSLVEQWRDELRQKFGLDFVVYSRDLASASNGNPFEDHHQIIARLDQLARSDELPEQVCAVAWDLVIFDEAHKLSAHYSGDDIKRTKRYQLAERLRQHTRHLLLMTATPHNGKEEDFQLFLSILDSDRFLGRFRNGAQKTDVSDVMRRMVKEELVKFDGTPLFPPRKAYTVNYELSDAEHDLYEAVTNYVKEQMGKADELEGKRRGSVGFALTSLQRRLASSPAAILRSLERRHERLRERLDKIDRGRSLLDSLSLSEVPEDEDELSAEEEEELEDSLIDRATAARTRGELEAEVRILGELVNRAAKVAASNRDKKWEELSRILQDEPEMRDVTGRLRKLIVFTEHRDTLDYLQRRIVGVLGNAEAVATIHGSTPRQARLDIQERFRTDPELRVLLATDAAGEGVNLQVANLMVNYDLPWNPNRLEQRFGRIHRIGQRETCHLWSLVARETREGDVFHRLLKKIEAEKAALGGKVFDVLGEVFEGTSLRDLLIEAIRYGDQPERRAEIERKVEEALDTKHILEILERNALASETMTQERLFAVKEEMDKAEARRLQPHFIEAFFLRAFDAVGGSIHKREAGRYEINYVPPAIRDRDRRVQRRYERICFTKEAIHLDKPGHPSASLVHPGHPLMAAVTDAILEQHANLLRQGAVLVDPVDEGYAPYLLVLFVHEVKTGDGQTLSRRIQFVRVDRDGSASFAGYAPHLDLEVLAEADKPLIRGILEEPWLSGDLEAKALAHATSKLAPEHFEEVADRHVTHIDKTLFAVNERLSKEINYQTSELERHYEAKNAGRDVRLAIEQVKRTLNELEARLHNRRQELLAKKHVISATPVVLSCALVVPQGLLRKRRGEPPPPFSADAEARKRIESIAMEAVRRVEEAMGHEVKGVSAQKCGWDLTAIPPAVNGALPEARHIEVKGRVKGASSVIVTRNEILYALNQAEKFWLAIVLVGENDEVDGPYYLHKPFQREPDVGASKVEYELSVLLERAQRISVPSQPR